jgi:GH35 family endo-1,4-beta-xylanase
MVADHNGTIELRAIDVELVSDTAFGGGINLLSDAQTNARIERFRKGNLTVKVINQDNRPVADALVHVQQTRHQFLFGCNAYELDLQDDSQEQRTYRQEFSKLFNYATLPVYWGSFEPQQGHPNYKKLDEMAKWCDNHSIATKGHPLVWHQNFPSWAPTDPDQLLPILHQRVSDLITHYKGLISIWDVVNEATAASNFKTPNGVSAWITRDGAPKVVETVLDWAREAAGEAHETFIYNDYQTNSQTLEMLSSMQQDNKLPDVIGIQAHMHQGNWPLLQLWTTCEEFAQFGRPLHFTETTVLSGPVRFIDWDHPPTDWLTTDDDEKKQAEYVTSYYKVLFSHPAVQAITWWDLSDKHAFVNAPAGLLRSDYSPKPAYHALYELIHERWWSDLKTKSDKTGIAKSRAFYGDYKITVTGPSGTSNTVTTALDSAQPDKTITVKVR